MPSSDYIKEDMIEADEISRLKAQLKTIEQIDCKKAVYYAELSHDLRQPLQAMKIFISLLKDENLTIPQARLTSQIEDSANHLNLWIDNLLEITKLESGGLKKHKTKFALNKMLQRLGAEYQAIASYKKQKLSYQGKNIEIRTDKILLERIIRNILHNAVKYSRGEIILRWYAIKNKVRIIIQDNGLGLKPEECRELFQAFYQCPRHYAQGTGLGLAVVKELTDILGIKVDLKSKWRKGTIFILTLPK